MGNPKVNVQGPPSPAMDKKHLKKARNLERPATDTNRTKKGPWR
jgi:hypothetical protein